MVDPAAPPPPDEKDVFGCARDLGRFVKSLWYVASTVLSLFMFINSAVPTALGQHTIVGDHLRQIIDWAFDVPTLIRSEKARAANLPVLVKADSGHPLTNGSPTNPTYSYGNASIVFAEQFDGTGQIALSSDKKPQDAEIFSVFKPEGFIFYKANTGVMRRLKAGKPSATPAAADIGPGDILSAERDVYIRAAPDMSAQLTGIVFDNGCVQVTAKAQLDKTVPNAALGGGWLPIRRVGCPT